MTRPRSGNLGLSVAGAALAHLLLLAGLSLAWAKSERLLLPTTDTVPVEIVSIDEAPRVAELPEPSLEAAPQDPAAALEPAEATPAPEPVKPDAVPPPDVTKPKPETKAKAPPTRAPPSPLDTSTLSSEINKALPKAKTKPLDTSRLAQEITTAAPTRATVDPRVAATLAQAIRAQVAPCWNPPVGGADVRKMTVLVRVQYGRDGRVTGQPQAGTPTGTTPANASFARAFAETARRAVLRCQPLKLPPDLYDLWANVEINFDPDEMA